MLPGCSTVTSPPQMPQRTQSSLALSRDPGLMLAHPANSGRGGVGSDWQPGDGTRQEVLGGADF